jgi:HK97 family phage major capsid protein
LVHFVRQTARVTQAAVVPEANVTTYSGATGEVSGEKPEGSVAFEAVTTPVKTVAVWIPATKRALSDAAQIRGIIDNELRDDLNEELEDQIINGDGVGENFTGILNTAGILTFAWDTDMLTTIRKARTYLQVVGRSRATALLVHPYDAETMDLLKDESGGFYFGGPAQGGVGQVWRVPVVESETMTEGVGLMGDFRKAVLWDREEASITVSDSHEDFFIRNMIAILAELRAAFGVIRPTAFVEVDLAAGS